MALGPERLTPLAFMLAMISAPCLSIAAFAAFAAFSSAAFFAFLAAFHCFKNATFERWSRRFRVLGKGAGTGQGSGGGETGSGKELAAVVRIDHDLVFVKVGSRLLEN